MKEPLEYFYEKDGIDLQKIHQIVCGEKYVAVILKNGNIGVCATLNNYVNIEARDLRFVDLKNSKHRIVLTAYFNAVYNYQNTYNKSIDIFEEIDFTKYESIVMIGFFRSLVDKFENERINLKIFDKAEADAKLSDINLQLMAVSKANAVILTSTSVFNGTFLDIVYATKPGCDIYTLGPSTIMHKEMFQYKNLKLLFGSVFEPHDILALKIIQAGGGTRQFMPYMKKVFLENNK